MTSLATICRSMIGLALVASAVNAGADFIRVCQHDDPGFPSDTDSIQEAVDVADALDTILLCEGLHTEADIEIQSKNLAIAGSGSGSIVQAAPAPGTADVRVFTISDSSISLVNLTIRHGNCASSCTNGGGLFIETSEVRVINSIIHANFASVRGGGVMLKSGRLIVADGSQIRGNDASGGGGIFAGPLRFSSRELSEERSLEIISSVISLNHATRSNGGGIEAYSTHVVLGEETVFSGNRSLLRSGGAVYFAAGSGPGDNSERMLKVRGATFLGNQAQRDGGAVLVSTSLKPGSLTAEILESTFHDNRATQGGAFAAAGGTTTRIALSTFTENKALSPNESGPQAAGRGSGGAIRTKHARLILEDSTVDENRSDGGGSGIELKGGLEVAGSRSSIVRSTISNNTNTTSHPLTGGLFLDNAPALVVNSTVSGNSGPSAAGVYLKIDEGAQDVVHIVNSTIAHNSVRGLSADSGLRIQNSVVAENFRNCVGTFVASGLNLDDDGSCRGFSHSDRISLLGSLSDNGGRTKTHALLPGSEAIGAGDLTVCTSAPVNAEDQRRVSRPLPASGACDLGAFEAEGDNEVTVTLAIEGPCGVTVTDQEGTACTLDEPGEGCGNSYPEGTLVELRAEAEPGCRIIEQSGCDASETDPLGAYSDCMIDTSDGQDSAVTYETGRTFTLTIEGDPVDGTGSGWVGDNFDDPPLEGIIDCAIEPAPNAASGKCSAPIPEGTDVVLSIFRNPGSIITEVSGCDFNPGTFACDFTMDGDRTVIVTIKHDPHFSYTIDPGASSGEGWAFGPDGEQCHVLDRAAEGQCSGTGGAGELVVVVFRAEDGSWLSGIGNCPTAAVIEEGREMTCEFTGADGDHVELVPFFNSLWNVTIQSDPASTGSGSVETYVDNSAVGQSACLIRDGVIVDAATCANDHPDGAQIDLVAGADADSGTPEWISGCDNVLPAPPHGQSICSFTLHGNRTPTVKILKAEQPASDDWVVVATSDQGEWASFEFPGFKNPRFNGEELNAIAQGFDVESNVFQWSVHYELTHGNTSIVRETGDMGLLGQINFFSDNGIVSVGELFSLQIETQPDTSRAQVLVQSIFVDDVWHEVPITWTDHECCSTVESIQKVAASDPHFVVQIQFVDEGAGLVSANLDTDPVPLEVLFHAGEPVGDGFAFDSFHAGAVPGIALNPLGDGAVVADVVDTTSGAVVDGLLTFRADTPGANLLLRQGQETEFPGVFITRLVNVAMDGGGVIAVQGRVSGSGISSVNDEAVWVCIAALCSIAVQEGMEPEGMPGVRLRFPGSPVVRDGKLLMRTVLEGTGIDSSNNFGLLLVDLLTGAVELVGQKGEAFAGDTIADFTSKAFSNNIPLVTVRLNGGFSRALARVEAGGLLPEIVPGDEFTLPDGTVGIVSGVLDIPETGGEDGRASAVGGGGYAIIVVFQDGRSGIVACTAACLEGGG